MKYNLTIKPNTTLINKTGGWRTFKPKIDLVKCISCRICEYTCPEPAIKMVKNIQGGKDKPEINYDYCKGCGVCADVCPVKAIALELENR